MLSLTNLPVLPELRHLLTGTSVPLEVGEYRDVPLLRVAKNTAETAEDDRNPVGIPGRN